MNELVNRLVQNKWVVNIFHSVIIILISFILYKSVTYILTKNSKFKLFTKNFTPSISISLSSGFIFFTLTIFDLSILIVISFSSPSLKLK